MTTYYFQVKYQKIIIWRKYLLLILAKLIWIFKRPWNTKYNNRVYLPQPCPHAQLWVQAVQICSPSYGPANLGSLFFTWSIHLLPFYWTSLSGTAALMISRHAHSFVQQTLQCLQQRTRSIRFQPPGVTFYCIRVYGYISSYKV